MTLPRRRICPEPDRRRARATPTSRASPGASSSRGEGGPSRSSRGRDNRLADCRPLSTGSRSRRGNGCSMRYPAAERTMSPDAASTSPAFHRSVDHRILDLLAERHGLVTGSRRASARAARGPRSGPEQQVLADREHAPRRWVYRVRSSSHVPIDSTRSRDQQARLKAEVPSHRDAAVAVVGGLGGMGRLLAQLFRIWVTRSVWRTWTRSSPRAAAAWADIVVISVLSTRRLRSSRRSGSRASRWAPDGCHEREGGARRCDARATQASVVGTHPMFRPTTQTLSGRAS